MKLRHIFEIFYRHSNEGVWTQKISNFMQGIKSAKLEIANLALLIPCMEFEFFCVQIPSCEVL